MIARIWTAAATPANAATYREHFEQHVLPALRALDGHVGAALLQRDDGELVELLVITRWQSWDAIRAFAGDDVEQAVVASEAQAVLARWDDRVRHYEVVIE